MNNKKNEESGNPCLDLLKEYPFNIFFINFICHIRDSLLYYFEDFSQDYENRNISTKKALKFINDNFLDFDAKMEPKIQILKDMCNTKCKDFNKFIKNLILK